MANADGFSRGAGRYAVYTKDELDEKLGGVMSGDALLKSGGTMTGSLTAKPAETTADYQTAQVRNITISNAVPSGGNDGDIWLRYT